METVKEYLYKGLTYKVYFVDKSKLFPFFGRAYYKTKETEGYVIVRNDLCSIVKNFVIKHELYHLGDTRKWGGVFGQEFRANIIPGLKDPIGLIACVIISLTSIDRIKLYIDRVKKKY